MRLDENRRTGEDADVYRVCTLWMSGLREMGDEESNRI